MQKRSNQNKTLHRLKPLVIAALMVLSIFSGITRADGDKGDNCQGHFVNPITDVCWECLFPITIGSADVVHSSLPDTDNPKSPIGVCPAPVGFRVGLNIGYWEPVALTDVTPQPYCMVNLGFKMDLGVEDGMGGKQERSAESSGSFYYVHWYKYPLVYWLQIITSLACMQTGEFDIAYLTELDPTWNDDELTFILNPEAILFANPVAQSACAADAVKANMSSLPIDSLFWCAGTQGSLYPLSGTVADEKGPVQAATLLTERMDFKMHREGLLWDSTGKDAPAVCNTYPSPIMPKSRYRYEMTNVVADGTHCYPFGHSVVGWEQGHIYPGEGNQFGFLVWQKRNCTFL